MTWINRHLPFCYNPQTDSFGCGGHKNDMGCKPSIPAPLRSGEIVRIDLNSPPPTGHVCSEHDPSVRDYISSMEKECAGLRADTDAYRDERDSTNCAIANLRADADIFARKALEQRDERNAAVYEVERLKATLEAASVRCSQAVDERDRLKLARGSVLEAVLTVKCERLEAELVAVVSGADRLRAEISQLRRPGAGPSVTCQGDTDVDDLY